MEKTYEQGIEDCFEYVRFLRKLHPDEIKGIFEINELSDMYRLNITGEEFVKKIQEYKENNYIVPGDICYYKTDENKKTFIITKIYSNGYFDAIYPDGEVFNGTLRLIEKTGHNLKYIKIGSETSSLEISTMGCAED